MSSSNNGEGRNGGAGGAVERREYDFVSLGGGSAGYAAARTARALGLRTALVEGGREVGGLCILRGCMPSKTMIESANRFLTLRRAPEFGLRAENLRVIQSEILARKRRLVKDFADYRHGQLEKGGFDFIRGRARFAGPHTLGIFPHDGAADTAGSSAPFLEIQTRAAVIATGSHAACPPIPGLDEVDHWTSDDVLELAELPRTVVVLGAGAIGLEAAHHLSGLGVGVTVVQRSGHVLRDADTDVSGALEEALAARGVRFYCGAHLTQLERDVATGGKRVWFERMGERLSVVADRILCALGRLPNTGDLGLEHTGVRLEKKGGVITGPDQRAEGVADGHLFAAGDVCGPYEIVHLAIQQGEIAARNAARLLGKLDGAPEPMDYRLRLFALFTEPQLAVLGLTEREAAAHGMAVRTAKYAFADHGKALVRGETDGFVKLVVAETDGPRARAGEIVGAAAVGPEASELIHEIAVAMHFRATALDLARVPHYHPTLSEIWTYPAEELAGL